MNMGEDESSSTLNGRLRPRKSANTTLRTNKLSRKSQTKAADKAKRTSNLPKGTQILDLSQLLCPYCDRKFASKQTVSKHVRRIHLSVPKQDSFIACIFCNHSESDSNVIVRHMVDNHPNQYFACLDCFTRYPSTTELAEHKLNGCEKQKLPYRSKLRQKTPFGSKKSQKSLKVEDHDFSSETKEYTDAHRFNGVVISCELKPSQVNDEADIEDNITTNLILPPSKNLGTNAVMEKNAVIVLDDIQWNKRMPTNFSFHNTDADQILSRLGVVHRSPRTGESTKLDWSKNIEEPAQKFEKCFDTSFYSKVASNVHENLSKFLDGSFNFNPDAEHTIKTRKSKNSVVINTAEGFPILLAYAQYARNIFDGYMPRAIAPKHKWKWDSDKNPMNPDDIKRDSHLNNCIITLVSSLDIWTQLCMRRKFEDKFGLPPLAKKTEKQNIISKELKDILESREIPSTSTTLVKSIKKPIPPGSLQDFPSFLGLTPALPMFDPQPAVLSGEWVRPRCYVCCACGAQTRDSRSLSSHISTQHPNAQVQHYEIVGELLLNADILKHLYVPPSQMCNRTRPLRGFRECTKCKKSISLEDLHQHMLDCAGDTPAVRRKCRYRPFGVRRRRPRLPDNTIRKKIRKDIRRQTRQTRQKSHIRPRPKIRSEVGDAETIRKMIADLPAKRHRVVVNPTLRPRNKNDKQRKKVLCKRHSSDISKNIKVRDIKDVNEESHHSGSTNDINEDKSDPNNDKDDEDNKPLKPRIKRVLTQRQNQSIKRQVAMNRAKRRVQLKDQKASLDILRNREYAKMTNAFSDKDIYKLSNESSSQRIDIHGSGYNRREHSGRSRSSNSYRDEQRPNDSSGFSGSNGNINNDFSGPSHNAPLKHSIARLTSDSEPYERSLHYHNLYLAQQDSDDLNEHVPTGQQRLFENEAVVTKLDKPPLHFNTRGDIDPYGFHKSKLNKPRKGLNDCIQMLREKLVEPLPTNQSSHSAMYSDAEYPHAEVFSASRRSSLTEYEDMNSRPAEVFSRHQLIQDSLLEIQNDNQIKAKNLADLSRQCVNEPKSFAPRNSRAVTREFRQKSYPNYTKRESARRRSVRSEKSQSQRKFDFPPPEFIPRRSVDGYPVNVSAPSKVHPVQTRRNSSCSLPINHSEMGKSRTHELYTQNALLKSSQTEYHNEPKLSFHRMLELQHQPQFQAQFPPQLPHQLAAQLVSQMQLPPPMPPQLQLQLQLHAQGQPLSQHQRHSPPQPKRQSPPKAVRQSPPQMLRQTSPRAQRVTPLENRSHMISHHRTSSEHRYQIHQRQILFEPQPQLISACQTLSQQPTQPQQRTPPRSQNQFQQRSPCQRRSSPQYPHSPQIKLPTPPHPQAFTQSQTSPPSQYRCTLPSLSPPLAQLHPLQSSQIQMQSPKTQNTPLPQLEVQTQLQIFTPIQPLSLQSPRMQQPRLHQIESDIRQVEMKESEVCKQSHQSKQKPDFDYTESNYPKNRIIEVNVSPKIDHKIYPESGYNKVPVEMNLAQQLVLQTNLAPDLPVPLDLSVNALDSLDMLSKQRDPYITPEYNCYETLDLSNKNSDHMRADLAGNNIDVDGVVDLRVKSNSHSLKSCEKVNACDDATDLTINTQEMDNLPTDLSLKRHSKNNNYDYENITVNYECIQDLSSRSNSHDQELAKSVSDIDSEIPTDLSGKRVNNDLPEFITNIVPETVKDTSEQNVNVLPADLSAIKDSQRETIFKEPENKEQTQLKIIDINEKISSDMQDNYVSKKDEAYSQDDYTQIRNQKIALSSHENFENVPNQLQQPHINSKNENDSISYQATENQEDCTTRECPSYTKTQDEYESEIIYSPVIGLKENIGNNKIQSRHADKLPESLPEPEINPKSVVLTELKVIQNLKNISPESKKTCANYGQKEKSPENYKLQPDMTLSNRHSNAITTSTITTVMGNTLQSSNRQDFETPGTNSFLSLQPVSATVIDPLNESILEENTSLYSLKSPSTSLNRDKSTTPIFSSTDTCISAKIETSNISTLNKDNEGESSANTVVTEPVYTLIDTKNTETPSDSVHIDLVQINKIIVTSNVSTPTTTNTVTLAEHDNFEHPEEDLETAKKIAMLPKELIEILGTMPEDHRNQLLNILPHYVSKSPNMSLRNISPKARGADNFENVQCDEIKPFANLESTDEPLATNSINQLNSIIDLTVEDDVPIDIKTPPSEEETTTNKDSVSPATNPIKQKINDQTASLRAVRIKAPSERNKSASTENTPMKNSSRDTSATNNQRVQDLVIESIKWDLEVTMAVQEAEASTLPPKEIVEEEYDNRTTLQEEPVENLEAHLTTDAKENIESDIIKKKENETASLQEYAESIVPSQVEPVNINEESTLLLKKCKSNIETLTSLCKEEHKQTETLISTLKEHVESLGFSTPPPIESVEISTPSTECIDDLKMSSPPMESVENFTISSSPATKSAEIIKKSSPPMECVKNLNITSSPTTEGADITEKSTFTPVACLESLKMSSPSSICEENLKITTSAPIRCEKNLETSILPPMEGVDTLEISQPPLLECIENVETSTSSTKEIVENFIPSIPSHLASVENLETSACLPMECSENLKTVAPIECKENMKKSPPTQCVQSLSTATKKLEEHSETFIHPQKDEDQEDSEDDISLAIILKQKQTAQNQVNVLENLEDDKKIKKPGKKRTKNKNQKKTGMKDAKNNPQQLPAKSCIISTKKSAKSMNQKTTSTCKNIKTDLNETTKTDIGPVNKVSNVTTKPDKSPNYSKILDASNLPCDVVIRLDKLSSDVSQYETIKLVPKIDTVEPKQLTHEEKDKSDLHQISGGSDNFIGVPSSNVIKVEKTKSETKFTTNQKKVKKQGRSKKTDNVNNILPNENDSLQQEIVERDNNSTIPLRRSRRGKSMFVESTSIEKNDTECSEAVVEQKTPLTKKQLIFSKMLLDEEKPKPVGHSTSEEQNLIINDQTKDKSDALITNVCLPVNEEASNQNKGTKRTISPNGSKKTKKKKSSKKVSNKNNDFNEEEILENNNATSIVNTSNGFNDEELNENKQGNIKFNISEVTDENQRYVNSTEKRKNNNQISFELSQSPNAKKNKIVENEKQTQLDAAIQSSTQKINKKDDTNQNHVPEIKTACYNLHVPTKRGRSKSVGVKSSNAEKYDPYDIDFVDVAEHNDSIIKRNKTTIQRSNSNKKGKSAQCKKNVVLLDNTIDSKLGITDERGVDSDDVPLKTYLEQKVKMSHVTVKGKKINITVATKVKPKITKSQTTEDNVAQTEAEKDLKSEQFLEAFGFFSQRKPRKSNILAAKKISETIHITNESDDRYFGFVEKIALLEKTAKKQLDLKKAAEQHCSKLSQPKTAKKTPSVKRRLPTPSPPSPEAGGKKKKIFICPNICKLCRIEFSRTDNFLRHQMTLLHASKLSEIEMQFETVPVREEPNYLVAYRQYIERYKLLTDRLALMKKRNPEAVAKIILPTQEQMMADIHTAAKEQLINERKLSNDEALFLDCCELLKDPNAVPARRVPPPPTMLGLDRLEKAINEISLYACQNDDGDVDSITARNILESEEVRYLENDLISGLKEAANAKSKIADYQISTNVTTESNEMANTNEMTIPNIKSEPNVTYVTSELNVTSELKGSFLESESNAANKTSLTSDPNAESITPSELFTKPESTVQSKAKTEPNTLSEPSITFVTNKTVNANVNERYEHTEETDIPEKRKSNKSRRSDDKFMETVPIKEKMYPDIIEDIDMFEDKFDKIKRKCRSQAAAAKQPQTVVETNNSQKGRKKSESQKKTENQKKSESHKKSENQKKSARKLKKNSKKSKQQVTQVPTKGALKGFDGIKVSIPTSDINMSGIVPITENINIQKKKKPSSRKKSDKRDSELNDKYDNDCRKKETVANNNKVDVYEFMDNEDAELFEFRPSTLMERFKSISNKEIPIKSKPDIEENSSDSGSDGDDFVYMSDDYVCSDDETENSLMSCETGNIKIGNDTKKCTTPQKRKDVVEKNAVMGKIFKHNAVRAEKKSTVVKEPAKPKANLDQLFDSLLEEQPNLSTLDCGVISPSANDALSVKRRYSIHEPSTSKVRDEDFYDDTYTPSKIPRSPSPVENETSLASSRSSSVSSKDYCTSPTRKYDSADSDCAASTSENNDNNIEYPSLSRKYQKSDISSKYYDIKSHNNKNSENVKLNQKGDYLKPPSNADIDQLSPENSGVARQRARRKCTVGKQNVLAETWSSESEPDGGPPRPNSTESVVAGGRKKRSKKREGQTGKRGYKSGAKKSDSEIRVSSNSRNTLIFSASGVGMSGAGGTHNASAGYIASSGGKFRDSSSTARSGIGRFLPSTSAAAGLAEAKAKAAAAMPAPTTPAPTVSQGQTGLKGRSRSQAHYWSSEGDNEQEHQQQHGWIVGDSHKKLVTMLAHAKGRKRNDDKDLLEE